MNREPFDEHLSLELRSLVQDANPPPTLRPATGPRASNLPRPWIIVGGAAAAIVAMLALLLSGGSATNRQHVASEGKAGAEVTSTTDNGVVVPVAGDQVAPATTITHAGSTTTTPKKSSSTSTTIQTTTTLRPAPALAATVYNVPSNDEPWGITTGPDGNVWTVGYPNSVARITPGGTVTVFPHSPATAQAGSGCPPDITVGPDKNLWFTEERCDKIGRITTSGTLTEFDVPFGSGGPITAGGDGALWFGTAGPEYTGAVGRLTTDGKFTKFDVGCCWSLTTGSDGNVWAGTADPSSPPVVRRITSSGASTDFAVPHLPLAMTLAPDGNVWYCGDGVVGRITSSGSVTEFPAPLIHCQPFAITTGPDGSLWAAGQADQSMGPYWGQDIVVRITPSGSVTPFQPPVPGESFFGIASGSDGNLWVTASHNKVAKFAPPKS